MTDAQAALAQVREALPKGSESVEWEWWTSNSFRRLSVRGSTVDGGVMYAYVAHDGQPDISIRQSDMALIAACSPANMTAILAHVEAQEAEIERLHAAVRHEADCAEAYRAQIEMMIHERDELRKQIDECSQMLARQAATIRELSAGPRG